LWQPVTRYLVALASNTHCLLRSALHINPIHQEGNFLSGFS
jgi:hypothetical protein